MLGGLYDFTLPAGADHGFSLVYSENGHPIDITGWSALSEVRHRRTKALLVTAAVQIVAPQQGVVRWFVSGRSTATLKRQTAVWDLVLIRPNGSLSRPIGGACRIAEAVTVVT